MKLVNDVNATSDVVGRCLEQRLHVTNVCVFGVPCVLTAANTINELACKHGFTGSTIGSEDAVKLAVVVVL